MNTPRKCLTGARPDIDEVMMIIIIITIMIKTSMSWKGVPSSRGMLRSMFLRTHVASYGRRPRRRKLFRLLHHAVSVRAQA